ncbi:MAG: hypothetical protein IPI67_40640 [Myxococcales bacterium]|nr:hypothetical protein [Myxococcales bacterium]
MSTELGTGLVEELQHLAQVGISSWSVSPTIRLVATASMPGSSASKPGA